LCCLCTHLKDGLWFIQYCRVHTVNALKSGFVSRPLQMFALFSSTLFTIEVHSEISPFSISLSTLCTCCTTEATSWWLDIQILAMLTSMSRISGILVLGRRPSRCTLNFTDYFDVSHSTAHTRVQPVDFTDTGVGREYTT
jgi:hypothetical protein